MAKKLIIRDTATTINAHPHDGALEESTVSAAALTVLDDDTTADMRTTLGVSGLTWKGNGSTLGTSGVDNGVDSVISAIDFQSGLTAAINGTTLEVDAAGGPGGEAFPVGAVYINVTGVNPGTELGYGTWSAFGAGRVMVGFDAGDTDFDTAQETGGAKTKAISAHTGTAVADHASHTHSVTSNVAVGDHASHTHTYTEVPNHTHPVNVTDPGHTHLTQRYPTATGASSGFTIDTSMSGTLADNTLPTKSNTTGITATTSNPSGGVATGTTAGPSATLSHSVTNNAVTSAGPSETLTHSVTQPSAHSDLNVVQPYIVAHFWLRSA